MPQVNTPFMMICRLVGSADKITLMGGRVSRVGSGGSEIIRVDPENLESFVANQIEHSENIS